MKKLTHLTETGMLAGRPFCRNPKNTETSHYVHAVYATQLNPALFVMCEDCVNEIRENSDAPEFADTLVNLFGTAKVEQECLGCPFKGSADQFLNGLCADCSKNLDDINQANESRWKPNTEVAECGKCRDIIAVGGMYGTLCEHCYFKREWV